MQIGKLDSELLKDIVFRHITYKRPEVLVRAGIGEDCAVVDCADKVCILSTDPITASASQIGRLAVHVSCNDIASNGVEPLGIMLSVMLPPDITKDQIEDIMRQAGEEARKLSIEIIGGHTEITEAVRQPVIVATAIGQSKRDEYVSGQNIKTGDILVMTKTAGMEGIGIFAHDYEKELSEVLTDKELKEAKELLSSISVRDEGLIAGRCKASGMHDVTEGGILGAVWEMCEVSGLGVEVYTDLIPVLPVTKKICDAFKIDPLRLISSGCMLIVIERQKEKELFKLLGEAQIKTTVIGKVIEKGRYVICGKERSELLPPQSDQLYKMSHRE